MVLTTIGLGCLRSILLWANPPEITAAIGQAGARPEAVFADLRRPTIISDREDGSVLKFFCLAVSPLNRRVVSSEFGRALTTISRSPPG